jgi:hypothetical protein
MASAPIAQKSCIPIFIRKNEGGWEYRVKMLGFRVSEVKT